MPIELPELWDGVEEQYVSYDGNRWVVAQLIMGSKNLPVFDLDIKSYNFSNTINYGNILLEVAAHIVKMNEASLKYPIILHPEGYILDGRHRMLKALVNKQDTIKAVRFGYSNLPPPCSTYDVND